MNAGWIQIGAEAQGKFCLCWIRKMRVTLGSTAFFFLELSSVRFQARHICRDTSCAYYGRISLSDGLRMSQMMFSCPSLRAFIIAFILFSLPLLHRASARISAAAIQLCSMRGDSNHFPLRHQLIIWETNEGKIIQWWILNHRKEFLCLSDPSELHSPPPLPNWVTDCI